METINKEHFQALITEKNLIKLHENMNMLQQKIQGNILDTLIQEFDLPTLQKGRIAQARKDYELAEHYYTIAIKKGNTEGRQIGFLNLGGVYCMQGKYEKAQEYYKQCIALGKSIYADKANAALQSLANQRGKKIADMFIGLRYTANNDSSYENVPSAYKLATFKVPEIK